MRIKVIPYNTTEYGSLSAFPGTGESGKYYLALDTMILYVWSSNAYTAASFRYEGKPTYHGSYLKSGYLEFTMAASPAPIDWHSGDYIRYNRTGRVYKMYNVPQTERQSGTNHNGDSFAYRNVQFYDSVKELELTPFRDYVQGQNQYFFSSKQDVQTTEPVSGIVARLNANLTDYFGSGVWNVTIAENISSSFEVDVAKDYSVSGTCLDALNAIYETWNELGWGFSVVNGVNTITIGYPNVAPATSGNRTNVFSYGSGLTALKRNTGSLNDFCTRMHVFGTERNLINRYYNGKDIYNAASVYIPNLMIPLEHWGTTSSKPDASKAYIEDQSKIDLYGLITKDVYFDGTDGKPEVYPSIEEQTIEVLKAAKTTLGKTGAGAPDYYPQTNDDTIRVDAVKSIVTMPVDDGSLSSSGSRYIDTYDATISSPIVNGQSRTSRSAGETTLYEYTFDDSGIVDVKWEGALKFVLNQALGANDYLVLRLCIYKGSVTRSNRLSAIEFSKVSDVTNGQILSLDITKAIGTREEQFTGKIILTLEYYFVVSGGGTRTITITKEGDVTTSVGLREALASTFKVKTQQIGFDISKMTSSGGASLALKSGMCAGREFPITRAVYNSSDDSWTLTCKRTQDNSTEIYYPNAQFPIVADELFVILGITMPEEYILAQSERLYALGQELYNRVSVYKPSYEPSIDSKQVLANITAHPSDEQYKLIEGKYMRLYDTDIISGDHSAEVLITELTIGEGDAEIATYRVVLSDKATVSGGITRSIANISNEVQQMQSAQRSASGGTIPDGGTNVNPVFIKDGVPQAVEGIDVPGDIHTGSDLSVDGDADVNGDITSEQGDIQALGGGVSANGIADLSQSGSGGAGTVTDVKVNNVSQPQSDGTVSITLADVALSGNYNDLNNKPTIADAIKFDANVSYQETTPFTPINGLISLPAYKTWAQLLPSGGIPLTDLSSSVQTSLGKADNAIPSSLKGAANGVAELDANGLVPSSQLPSYVDDVLEYASLSAFPATGETGKIYVALDTNLTYRWSGSAYVEISPSLALGETSSTAYRGDRGKTAYDHSQLTSGNPHNVTKSDVGLGLVANQTITVTNTSVTDGEHTFDKYVHPTTTAVAAAAVKVGNDSLGHVVLGAALTLDDIPDGSARKLADYVTLATAQTITGAKTFSSLITASAGLTATGGNIQAQAGGVAANGIADLAMVSGGGSGTLTQIKINTVALTDSDGVVTIPIGTGLDVNSSTGAISVSSTFQTQIGHGETAYNYFSSGILGASHLPVATASALGAIKIGYTESGKYYAVQLDSSNKAYVYVPWENTTYTLADLVGSSAIGGTSTPIYYNGSSLVAGTALGTMAYASTGDYLSLAGGEMTGAIQRHYSSANDTPAIDLKVTNNVDIWIFRVSDSYYATSSRYGFGLKYLGSGGGNNNSLALISDNQNASTQIQSVVIQQDGVVTFNSAPYVGGNIVVHAGNIGSYVTLGYSGENITLTPSSGTAQSVSLSTLINGLDTGGSMAQRGDYIVAQYAGGGTTELQYFRRPLSNIFAALNSTDINNAYGFTITGTASATYALATISSNASNGNTAYGYFSGGKLKSANIDLATGDNNGQVKIAGTNVSVKGLGSFAYISSLAFSGLSSHPTTISGYGITDAYTETDVDASISTLSASIGSIKASLGSIAYRESDEFASYYDFNVVRNYFDINGNANNANLLSGLPIHTGRNNEINKIVRTDSSGYIQAGWINTTSGNFTGTPDRIYASNDGYIRYMTPANLYENTKQTISDTLKLQSITGALGEHEAQIRDLGDGIMSNSNRIWLLEDFFTHGGSIYGTVSINNGGLSVTGATTLGNGVNCIGASGQNDLYLMRTNGANYIHIPSGTDLIFDHRTYGSSSSTVRMTILSNGGVSFTGAIAASGAATLGSTLSVSGAATFLSTISASGNINSSSNVIASGGVAAGGIADLSMN